MKIVLYLSSIILITQSVFSFSSNDSTAQRKIFISWGWNRGHYTNSDIKFKGTDNNFTLHKVRASDRQSDFSLNKYFNPTQATIPQYNFRAGYFLKENLSVSFGFDHMKYVVDQYQTTTITGEIKNSGTVYDGTYDNDEIDLDKEFLEFEHTDGLNYLNGELRRIDQLIGNKNISLNLITGAGLGVLFPKTNTRLLGQERHDKFHISGYGLGALAGLNATFFDHFFLQYEYKGGFIHMPDIKTSVDNSHKASQHFFFSQFIFSFGGYITFNTNK